MQARRRSHAWHGADQNRSGMPWLGVSVSVGYLYFSTANLGCEAELRRMPVGGGTAELLARGFWPVVSIAVDPSYVFFIAGGCAAERASAIEDRCAQNGRSFELS